MNKKEIIESMWTQTSKNSNVIKHFITRYTDLLNHSRYGDICPECFTCYNQRDKIDGDVFSKRLVYKCEKCGSILTIDFNEKNSKKA